MDFLELVLDNDISICDLRKYDLLIKDLRYDWIKQSNNQNPFHLIVDYLVQLKKVSKFANSILRNKLAAEGSEENWYNYFNLEEDVDWASIHTRNSTCTIETQLQSFYSKVFHFAITTNDFLCNAINVTRHGVPFVIYSLKPLFTFLLSVLLCRIIGRM